MLRLGNHSPRGSPAATPSTSSSLEGCGCLWIRKLDQRKKQGLGHPQAKDKNPGLLAPGPTLWYLVLVSERKQAHRSDDNILVPEHVTSTCCVPGPAPRASCASINVISESRLCEAGTILSLVPAKPIKDGGRRRRRVFTSSRPRGTFKLQIRERGAECVLLKETKMAFAQSPLSHG